MLPQLCLPLHNLAGHAKAQARFHARPHLGRIFKPCMQWRGAHGQQLDGADRLRFGLLARATGEHQGDRAHRHHQCPGQRSRQRQKRPGGGRREAPALRGERDRAGAQAHGCIQK
ncbi:hypothetical protein SDC9_147302 [bioreactor metagenome]|uniref:Uncharacterized protein n=1 Tax=bioreactor metagenome TaxID=1076179 RepID=A0A645EDM8_9ZZZZ